MPAGHWKRLQPRAGLEFPAQLEKDFAHVGSADGSYWAVRCRKCKQAWRLYKTFPVPYLAPLQYHALSHVNELPPLVQRIRGAKRKR